MLAVISPAKTLDYESSCPPHRPSRPQFLDEAAELIAVLRKKTRPQLQSLMKISENLASLNFERYKSWSPPFAEDNARAALLAFKGDVYTGFDLQSYGREDFAFAQKHLRILSGLYGVLRPMDLMQPYRLEMGTPLKTDRGENLYEFWGDRITRALNSAFKGSGSDALVNLASKEYFSAVRPDKLKGEVITPVFKEKKNDDYRVVALYAKKARGAMCDFMIRNRVTAPAGLRDFDVGGYRYNPKLSDGNNWVFTRDKVPRA
ncbi:MAG: peroxide stress protein YaaA [Verrucomicrobiales bacterium]